MTDLGGSYTLEIREKDKRLSIEPMPDPFHNTTIYVRGWRSALAVLLRRYRVSVHVNADRERVDQVMALDHTYGERG